MGFIHWRFKPNVNVPLLANQRLTGIHLAHQAFGDNYFVKIGPALMIVSKIDGIMERVGFGWVEQFSYDEFDKSGEPVMRDITHPDMLSPL